MATIRVGNAPCSWGSLEFEGMGEVKFTADQMLDELVATGYTGTELGDWGFMPTDPAAFGDLLHRRNVAITGAFVPVALRYPDAHKPGADVAVRTALLIADAAARSGQDIQPYLVLADDNGSDPIRTRYAGRATDNMAMTAVEWHDFAVGAHRVARSVLDATGLRTVFHHHCAGFVETPAEIDRLLSETDPALIGLVFDTGHYVFGAGSCEDLPGVLDHLGSRIWYMHFKDCDPMLMQRARAGEWDYFECVRNGIFCELGKGCVDFPAVKRWLEARNYDGFITVEQDVLPGLGSPRESAQRNRDYLRSIGL